LAVASNKPSRYTERILTGLAVRDRFTVILGPEDVTHTKPHPEMIIKALAVLNTKSENTLFVGDTQMDLDAGRGAGVPFCLARYGYGDEAFFTSTNSEYSINKPVDLLNIVGNHNTTA